MAGTWTRPGFVLLAALLGVACSTTDGGAGAGDAGGGGTDTTGDAGTGGCVVGDTTHAAGETFPSDDGCNTCSCGADGQVACTAMACAPVCQVGDATYLPGETWMVACNQCTCDADGTWSCTEADCTPSCTHEGETYDAGQSFPAGDGCNTCTCQDDGSVVCTEIACAPTCEHGGQTYAPGESFPADDGCNSCTCQDDGTAACTLIDCAPVCEHEGQLHDVGDHWTTADGCNLCSCLEGGELKCTTKACVVCEYDGQTYEVGQSFPANDGCNDCACQEDGSVVCSEIACPVVCVYQGVELTVGQEVGAGDGCGKCVCMGDGEVECISPTACTCEPVDGNGLHYIGQSVEECMLIDFFCDGATTYFGNDCGCGCEQSPACPDTLSCKPGTATPECSDPAFSEACPYTVMTKSDMPGCCGEDAECGFGWVCGGADSGDGVCKEPAEGSACWSDGECGTGQSCVGGWTCPCDADCDGADEPGKCTPVESECTKNEDCPSGVCVAGPICDAVCAAGDPSCCHGNVCAPDNCGPMPPQGCATDADCPPDAGCVTDDGCHASACGCSDGEIVCTADCQPGQCIVLP